MQAPAASVPDPQDSARTAFTLSTAHVRRDANRITCLVVDPRLRRLFLGLSNGYVEEHQLIVTGPGAAQGSPAAGTNAHGTAAAAAAAAPAGPCSVQGTRLVSGRKLYRNSPVAELCSLPVALRVVARSQDGNVMVCPYDSADVLPVSALKHAIAMAGDGALKAPARLAVACRSGGLSSGTACKLIVCMVGGAPGAAQSPGQQVQVLAQLSMQETILGLAWAGDSILLALPTCYRLVASGGAAVDIAPHTSPQPLLAPITPARQALMLLAENMVVVVDATGSAASAPLLLGGFPLALATVGGHVLAVTEDAVEVVDRTSGAQLQSIPFMHDDAWVQAARRLPCCYEDWGTGYVVFSTSTTVYCLAAVAPEQQAQELLKRRRYVAAMELVSGRCAPQAPPSGARRRANSATAMQQPAPAWCYQAVAQAAMLLLQELQFLPGLALLLVLPPSVWQPCQLLALFPTLAARWAREIPPAGLWGLHGGLTDLRRMVVDQLELQRATRPHPPMHATPTRTQRPAGGVPGFASEPSAQEIDACVLRAKTLIAAYLQQVRQFPGLQLLEALDTLCLQLLVECGLVGELEGAVCTPGCQALLRDAATVLTAHNRWHALALLRTTHNHTQEALDIWESLGSNEVTEDASHLGALHPSDLQQEQQPQEQQQQRLQEQGQQQQQVVNAPHVFAQLGSLATALAEAHEPGMRRPLPSAFAPATPASSPAAPPSLQSPLYMSLLTDVLERATAAQETSSHQPGISIGEAGPPAGRSSGLSAARGNQAALAAAATTALLSLTHATLNPGLPQPHAYGRMLSPRSLELYSVHSGVRLQLQTPTRPAARTQPAHSTALTPQVVFEPYTANALVWSDIATSRVTLPVMAVPAAPVPMELVLQKLPWLLEQYPGDALSVLCARPDLPLPDVLQLLASRTDDVRWRFLHHVVYDRPAAVASPSQPQSVASMSADAAATQVAIPTAVPLTEDEASALHTELALELIECISRQYAQQGSGQEQQQQQAAVRHQIHPARQGASGSIQSQPAAAAEPPILSRLAWLRCVLSGHLTVSWRYDAGVVLAAVHATCPGRLLLEEVALHRRRGDHTAALQILVVQLGDVEGAVGYCRQQQAALLAGGSGGPAGAMLEVEQLWMALLECCLRPGEGREPMYSAALRVLAAPSLSGGLGNTPRLDPIKVLNALPDSMPVLLAGSTLASMITATAHSHRNAQVIKALYRAQNLELKAQCLALSSQRVVVSETTTCRGCHRLLAGRIFTMSPSGLLLCDRCAHVPSGNNTGFQ